jgi:pilus assembly protein Flp/PilA
MRQLWMRAQGILAEVHHDESAQDLIEYALLAAMIALGAVVSMNVMASAVNTAFSNVHSKLHSHIGKHLGWFK